MGRGFWRDLPRDPLSGSRKLSSWHLLYSENVKNYNERQYTFNQSFSCTHTLLSVKELCHMVTSEEIFFDFNTYMAYTTRAIDADRLHLKILDFSTFKIFIAQSNTLSELVYRCQKKGVHF